MEQKQVRLALSAARLSICAVLVFMVQGATPRALAGHGRAPLAAARLNDCARAARPETLSRDFGRAVGRSPVWAVGFDGVTASALDGQKILWAIDGRFTEPVTVSGWRMRGYTPLQIQLVGNDRATLVILDPHHPLAFQPYHHGWPKPWAYFPSNIFPTQGGCWVLRAKWAGGSWSLRFSVP
jgi:hypothetical protein